MTSILTSIYVLTLKQTQVVHSADVDCINNCDRNVNLDKALYTEAKDEYRKSRCAECKQSWKLKKNMKNLGKLLRTCKCLFILWQDMQSLLLFFSNGTIVTIILNHDNTALEKIYIDNNLCGKFISSRAINVVFDTHTMFVTYSEPKLTYINFNQQTSSFSTKIFGKKKGKVVGLEPKIINIDLIGPCSRNLERKISLNVQKEFLLIWWHLTGDDVLPWTPVEYSTDRVNMLIYTITECSIEILCSVKVQGKLINAQFSKCHSNKIFTLEEVKYDHEISVIVCVYELIRDECKISFLSKLPLHGHLIAFDWNYTEDKLLVSDSDKTLLVYDLRSRTSIVKNMLFLPNHIAWHPDNCIAVVTGTESQIQCFDSALTCIKFQLFYKSSTQDILELNNYFIQHCFVQKVLWKKSNINNTCLIVLGAELSFILLKFVSGSILKNITPLQLISQYLKSNGIDESILLLQSLSWCHESQLSFQCLLKIFNYLLRQPLCNETKAGLELALGTFYNNVDNLPKKVIKMYQQKIRHLARRFFHHLLRYHQLKKSFLLSVDLESQDLFLDLYHVAKLKDENVLALVAIHKAEELDCSQDSCSESLFTSHTNSESSCSSSNEDLNCLENNANILKNPQRYNDHLIAQNYNRSFTFSEAVSRKQSRPSELVKNHVASDYLEQLPSSSYLEQHPSCHFKSSATPYNFESPKMFHYSDSLFNNFKSLTNCETHHFDAAYPTSYNRSLENFISSNTKPAPEHIPYIYEPKTNDSFLFNVKSEVCNIQNFNKHTNSDSFVSETDSAVYSKCLEEESEDTEDTRIKLVHFGII